MRILTILYRASVTNEALRRETHDARSHKTTAECADLSHVFWATINCRLRAILNTVLVGGLSHLSAFLLLLILFSFFFSLLLLVLLICCLIIC